MEIRANKELFENVIKTSTKTDDDRSRFKGMTEEQILEAEIQEVRDKLKGNYVQNIEPDKLEFLKFMVANYNYKSELKRLNEDIAKKLKEEKMRVAYDQSQSSFEQF